jgi:hypothetical protein
MRYSSPIRNGDLVWRRTEDSPLADHYGIAVHTDSGLQVMHRQRNNGGVLQPLDSFLMGFPLRGYRSTHLSNTDTDLLLARFNSMTPGEFDILLNNCEQWTLRYLGTPNALSDTDIFVLLAIVVAVFTIYMTYG